MYDVAVIGAGPAGSAAARYCAAKGLKTLLLDRCRFPRAKVCGGGVTTAALNNIGLPLPSDAFLSSVKNLRSVFGHKTVDIAHPRPFMVTMDRAVLDNFLVQKAVQAGAQLAEEETVAGLARHPGYWEIKTLKGNYRAGAIIGADGVYSTTARLTGLGINTKDCAFCLTVEVPRSIPAVTPDTISIYYNLLPKGYGWIFPKGDRLSLGAGCLTSDVGQIRQALSALAGEQGLKLPRHIKGHYIPYGKWSNDCLADGLILAGDAAGYVDPFTGEGIRFAVISGTLAAETIWNCCLHNQPQTKQNLAVYKTRCSQAFIRDFRYSSLLTRAFFAFPSVMHGFLASQPDIYTRFLNVLEGRYSYRRLFADVMLGLPGYCVSKTCQTQV